MNIDSETIKKAEELLMLAARAADKLYTMYLRGECSRRQEVDDLVDHRHEFRNLRKIISDELLKPSAVHTSDWTPPEDDNPAFFVQPVSEMTDEQKAQRKAPQIEIVMPEREACGTAHPQAKHIICTLPKGHDGMHTTGLGALSWDMAR